MEIKDNAFSRQFETYLDGKFITMEYAFQDRKIFLTKIVEPEGFNNDEFLAEFLFEIIQIAISRKLKVVPTFPKIVRLFRKKPEYKELLPPGIRI